MLPPSLVLLLMLVPSPAPQEEARETPPEGGQEAVPEEAPEPARTPEERVELENGATALLIPYPACEQVAVLVLQEGGVFAEPAGLPWLTPAILERGQHPYLRSSATLGGWTYREAVAPREALEEILRAESARLVGTAPDEDQVRAAAARARVSKAAEEADPRDGMPGLALATYHQVWRHGIEDVRVAESVDSLSSQALHRLEQLAGAPEGLTLVLVGGFEAEEAERLVRASFEDLAPATDSAAVAHEPIDFERMPPRLSATWSVEHAGVSLAWPAPVLARDRRLLAWLVPRLRQRAVNDPRLQSRLFGVCSNDALWMPGETPLFLHALIEPAAAGSTAEGEGAEGDPREELESALLEVVEGYLERGVSLGEPARIRSMSGQLWERVGRTWEQVAEDAAYTARLGGADEDEILGRLLAQLALDRAIVERLLGADPESALEELAGLEPEDLNDLLKRTLNADRVHVTFLVPAQ